MENQMALFDVAAPLLDRIDALAALGLPSWLRLILWGATAAVVSMLAYRWLSPQESIRRGKEHLRKAQEKLNRFDGEFAGAWHLMREMLASAFRQVGRVGLPAVAASLPLLFLLNWVSTTYGYDFPPAGEALLVRTEPDGFKARWVAPDLTAEQAGYPLIVVSDQNDRKVIEAPVAAPIPVIHKRQWWNVFFGNPLGYLPQEGPVDRIQAPLPRQQHLPFGPGWLRGWEFVFFASLVLVSVGLKTTLKIA
jgi:hypothetical protein